MSTNIQRYSDSWLFVLSVIFIVGNRFDKLTLQNIVLKKLTSTSFTQIRLLSL